MKPKMEIQALAIILIVLALGTLTAVNWHQSLSDSLPFNIPGPTLGGNQLWQDTFVKAGWRIQRNIITNHYRLLNRDNWRLGWGREDALVHELERNLTGHQQKFKSPDHLIILVHGMMPSPFGFNNMKRALDAEGYNTVAISYPSSHDSIEAHAKNLGSILNRIDDVERLSFVTHSMGGLIVRSLLARDDSWQHRMTVERIVMIAPPNQGSQTASWLSPLTLYRAIFGPAGQQLSLSVARNLPPVTQPFGVIAGGHANARSIGFNPLLPGNDDGIVRVAETKLVGMSDFTVVNDTHGKIARNPESITKTLKFLRTGAF